MEKEKTESGRKWLEWFEIPVADMIRAKAFYEKVFEIQIQVNDFGALQMGIFPHGEVGGALCQGEWYKPSPDGTLLYLTANPDLQATLDRIGPAGGQVILPKKQISPDHGYMALFLDCEGNRIALHSNQ